MSSCTEVRRVGAQSQANRLGPNRSSHATPKHNCPAALRPGRRLVAVAAEPHSHSSRDVATNAAPARVDGLMGSVDVVNQGPALDVAAPVLEERQQNGRPADRFSHTSLESLDVPVTTLSTDRCSLAELKTRRPHDFPETPHVLWGVDTKLRNQIQLSTYADCIGNSLPHLREFLTRPELSGVLGGVHVLPFYPSSADRGFAPLTYKKVDPDFGSWEDLEELTESLDVCVDFMVNHISQQSEEFQDFLEKHEDSEWSDLFIRFHKFWPEGGPTEEDLSRIYTRKPRPPFFEAHFKDGSIEQVWCTFDYEQIDLNIESTTGRKFLADQLTYLCRKGVKLIRLDAFGYTTKRRGTNCFFVEPDVWDVLEYIREVVAPHGTELLCEVHEHYSLQLKLASMGFWVYDFAIPMLTLQALYDGDAANLKRWMRICPKNQITTLDTHDGIGVVDVQDLMSQEQIERTKSNLFERGSNVHMRYNTAAYGNLDIYQLNCSYYSAVGEKDDWYLLARAIQIFTPGIPLVYYVGLLCGRNDTELLEATKVGRNINRHYFTEEEVDSELQRPVVQALFAMFRFRNLYPAFGGRFEVLSEARPEPEPVLIVPNDASGADGAAAGAWLGAHSADGDAAGAGDGLGKLLDESSLHHDMQPHELPLICSHDHLPPNASLDATLQSATPSLDAPPSSSAGPTPRFRVHHVPAVDAAQPLITGTFQDDGLSSVASSIHSSLDAFDSLSAPLCDSRDGLDLLSSASLASLDPSASIDGMPVGALGAAGAAEPQQAKDNMLVLRWSLGELSATLVANLDTKHFEIVYVDPQDFTEKVLTPQSMLRDHQFQVAQR